MTPRRFLPGQSMNQLKLSWSASCSDQQMGENMDVEALIIWLIVGAIAGWLAGMVVKGGGYGLIGDIIVGIIGGFIAGWLLPQLGIVIGAGIVAAIINAFIGRVFLLLVWGLFRRVAYTVIGKLLWREAATEKTSRSKSQQPPHAL